MKVESIAPPYVTVNSIGAAASGQPDRMGKYFLTNQINNNHPVYKKEDNSQVMFVNDKKEWVVFSTINPKKRSLRNKGGLTATPPRDGWQFWNSDSSRMTNEGVFLKHIQTFEKVALQSPASLKQLRLHSGAVVVHLAIHSTLRTSPFLSELVGDLKQCCFSPHDGVDILLDPFSPNLLYLVKSLLETGRCVINSEPEKDELESLLDAMGMDGILSQLFTEMSMPAKAICRQEEGSCDDIIICDDIIDIIICDSDYNDVKVEVDNHDPPEDGHDTLGNFENATPGIMGHKRKLVEIETECKNQKRRCFVNMNQDNHLSDKSNLGHYINSAGGQLWGTMDSVTLDEQNYDEQCIIGSLGDEHDNKEILETINPSKSLKECQKCGKKFTVYGKGRSLEAFNNHVIECKVEILKDSLSPKIETTTGTKSCHLCRKGNFNESELFEHLYRNHIELRRKIHKSVSENFESFYTLESKKCDCTCPLCGKVMKAYRTRVGLHWAVDHKKMRNYM